MSIWLSVVTGDLNASPQARAPSTLSIRHLPSPCHTLLSSLIFFLVSHLPHWHSPLLSSISLFKP